MLPKKIPLAVWAAKRYDPPPSPFILRKWCRDGEISPPPERVGREWRVAENAVRLTSARLSLVEQLQA